jgi:hypothetical protein
VKSRTVAPLSFILVPYLLIAFAGLTVLLDLRHHHYPHAAYAAANGLLSCYALVAYVGVGNSIVDVWMNIVRFVYRPATGGRKQPTRSLDWATVLYAGSDATNHAVPAPPSHALAGFRRERSHATSRLDRLAEGGVYVDA